MKRGHAESRADRGLENFWDFLYSHGKNGRHEETRTPDLYRVNFEVINLKPLAPLLFRFSEGSKYL
jgi:hypothetical protein